MPLSLDPIIASLHLWPTPGVSFLTFILCGVGLILFARFFGKSGICVYTAVAIIASNLQVLKAGYVPYFPQPIALGTTVFSATYLASDLLTELYGAAVARRNAALGFMAAFFLLILMVLALGVRPLDIGDDSPYGHFNQAHGALLILFNPSLSILVASLVSYGISQAMDIALFSALKRRTAGRFLMMRTFVSMAVSGLVDITVFSFLAWVVLSPRPISLSSLFFTYILGSYMLRLLIIVGQAPLLSLAIPFITRKPR